MPIIESSGATSLQLDASNHYILTTSGPVTLGFGGAAVVAGQFGGAPWAPIGAEQINGLYKVVWKNGGIDQYVIWTVDGNGNFLSQSNVLNAGSPELQSLEPGFNQDLDGGGIAARTPIDSVGSTALARVAGAFVLSPSGSSLGPQLRMSGSLVMDGQFGGAWAPIGAEQINGLYKVVWSNVGFDQYVIWTVDGNGNFLAQSNVLHAGNAELQSLEPGFNQDLDGGGIAARSVIESAGSTTLAEVAGAFVLSPSGSSLGPQLRMSGSLVMDGQFGGAWTPLGAEQINGLYKVVWSNVGADQFVIWTVDGNGNFLSQSNVLHAGNAELQSLEPGFNQDLDGGGITTRSVIESAGSTTLANVAGAFVLSPSGSSLGPQLRMSGSLVMANQFGNWTPVGTEQALNGTYQVVWQNGGLDQYVVWTTDSNGNFLSQSNVLTAAGLQFLEPAFNQDFNGGGIATRTVIESVGSTALANIANTFVVSPTTSALGPQLKMSGAAVTAGQFGNWTPIGAEQAANGIYQVAWKNGALDQYIGWNVDSAGNFISQGGVVSGASWYLEVYESALQQNLNGDGIIGPTVTPIEAIGSISLSKVADSYFFNYASGGPQLKMNGAYVAQGQFGAWTPTGVEQGGNGYWIAWKNGGADQYIVWETDGAGNFLRNMINPVAGSTSAIQQFEPFLHQDLNGDGVIPIEAFGVTKLVQNVGNNYVLDPMASLGGPLLRFNGANVTAGQFGANWTPIGAEQLPAGGFRVAWYGGNDQYTVWTTDGAGNFISQTGVVSGGSADLRGLEPSLQQDLNRDGVIAAVNTIEASGATSLLQIANAYLFGSIYGPELRMNGAAVDVSQLGPWTAIGAEQVGGGYQVAFRAGGADSYTVWNTDSNGNYVSTALNSVSGSNTALQSLEQTFQQDLNRDGYLGHFDISVNYTGDQAYASYFTAAARRWEQVIKADLPDVNSSQYGLIDDLRIEANVRFIDGVNGILGQAGPDLFRSGSSLPYHGVMTFDSADLATMANNGTLFSVILHEMGHVLGIGTLWNTLGLRSGSQYIGTNGVNAYHQLGGVGSVPLETTGGSGTALVHWSEAVFDNELMTGFAENPGVSMPLSIVTIGSLQDMGYKVDYAAADAYRLPGHLVAGAESPSMQADAGQSASAFVSEGPAGIDSVFEPLVLANDEVGNGSSGTASLSLLTSYAASTFVTPLGGGMGAVDAAQASGQDFLTKPAA